MKVIAIALLITLAWSANAANYAVLVAGSNGFYNYRHQADVCHAYHTLLDHGFDADNIIVMSYDDVASDEENPFPNTLYNKPADGKGIDYNQGCVINYKKEDVTPENFLAIIQGQKDKVSGGDGKVLTSTANDYVFLNFADHGAEGLIAFPESYLYAEDLIDAFNNMHKNNMYKQLVFYLEACESGSMFQNLETNINIYALSAASPTESSWAAYCPPEDEVDGTHIGSCLGDLFSVSWMEDSDSEDLTTETLQSQFETVKKLTTQSQVMQWGDLSWTSEVVGTFLGMKKTGNEKSGAFNGLLNRIKRFFGRFFNNDKMIDSRDVKVQYLINKFKQNPTQANQLALDEEMAKNLRFDEIFYAIKSTYNLTGVNGYTNWDCYRQSIENFENKCGAFTENSLKHLRYLHEFCGVNGDSSLLDDVLDAAC